MNDLIRYPYFEDEIIRIFKDAIHESEFKFSCSDLLNAGIESEAELRKAILRSIKSLKQAGILPHYHFKHIYITDLETGITYHDWRISRMGFLLALVHSTGKNPVLNRWRVELVKLLI